MSSGTNGKRAARCEPHAASLPWLMRTALGAPVVPEVKISMKMSRGVTSTSVSAAPANGASAASHAGVSVTNRASRGTASPVPSSSGRCSVSVTSSAQSVWVTSRARSAPRRVGLMPTSVAPLIAAAPSMIQNSGTLSSSTPTWNGASAGRCARRNAARCAHRSSSSA